MIVETDRAFSVGDKIETGDVRLFEIDQIPLMHVSGRSDVIGLIVTSIN